MIPIEIKSSQTLNSHLFDGTNAWKILTQNTQGGYLVYGGDKEVHQLRSDYVVGWRDIKNIVAIMENS